MRVERWSPKDGPFSEYALKQKLESFGYSVSRYVYSPGTFFPPHSHDEDKIDAVVSGVFRMMIPEGIVRLRAGDCLWVPRGCLHSAEVEGREAVVSLDAVKIG